MPERGPGRNTGPIGGGGNAGGEYQITGDIATAASVAAYAADQKYYVDIITTILKPNVTPALAESFYSLLSANLRGIVIPHAAENYRADLTACAEDCLPRIAPLQPGSRKTDTCAFTVLGDNHYTPTQLKVGDFLSAADTQVVEKDVTWFNPRFGAVLTFEPHLLFDRLYQSKKVFADPVSQRYNDWEYFISHGGSFADFILQTAVRVVALIGIAYGVGTLAGDSTASGTGAGGAGAGGGAAAGGGGGSAAAGGGAAAGAGAAGAGGGGTAAGGGGVAGNAAAGAAGAATGGVDSQVASSNAATASAISGVVSDIEGFVQKVDNFLSPFLKSVQSVTDQISNVVNTINNGLIKPLVDPINSIVTEVSSLKDFISGDVKQGLLGILKIPGDLSNALTSIDATMQRSILSLAAQNQAVLNQGLETYGPAMGLTGQTAIANAFDRVLPSADGEWVPPVRETLTEPANVEETLRSAQHVIDLLKQDKAWYARLANYLYSITDSGAILAEYNGPFLELVKEQAHRSTPTARLAVPDAARAWRMGLIPEHSARDEMLSQSFDATRQDISYKLTRVYPALADALAWLNRGLITADQAREILTINGYEPEDINRYLDANNQLVSPNSALDWWHRGLIDEHALDQLLNAYGMTSEQLSLYKESSYIIPAVGDWLTAADRELALQQNPEANGFTEQPPQAFIDAVHRLGIGSAEATLLWSNHLQLLPPQNAIQSYFRNLINRQQLSAFLRAYGFAPGMESNLIDSQRPQIDYRAIPTMVRAGILDDPTGRQILAERGFSDRDIDLTMKLAGTHKTATAAPDATLIRNDTRQTTIALYSAGTITRTSASTALENLGFTPAAAAAVLDLEDVKITAAEHQTEIQTTISEVQAGSLTVQQAQAKLAQYGLTTQEMAKATAQLNRMGRTKPKLPGEATLLDMYKTGLLDRSATIAALHLSGYSESWAELIVQLEEAKHGVPVKQ